jgi:hypothetical protein
MKKVAVIATVVIQSSMPNKEAQMPNKLSQSSDILFLAFLSKFYHFKQSN